MTRTPTTSVTAIAIQAAARAFAWGMFPGERLSGEKPGTLPSLLR
jgi:hypothetical protein